MNLSRRHFFKVTAAGVGATCMAVMGLVPTATLAAVRQFKLAHAFEARNNCTYCSVGCGSLLYSMGDGAKNAKRKIFHIEGDPDHPVSRGSLCPKGASLVDFVNSANRLHYPEVREAFSKDWKRISWEEAFDRIARHIKDLRDECLKTTSPNGTPINRLEALGMLTASASSNETGILTQKFMRALGIVATDSQARVCHGPTVSALASTFGRGAMTNTWVDIQNADFILVMGGNAAEAHPVGFKWAIEAKKKKGARLYVVDPRFNRTAAVSDFYTHLRSGSDIAFLGALINWLIENNKIQWEYVKAYTNASFIVREDYDFNEGLFSGEVGEAGAVARKGRIAFYDKESWFYEQDAQGYVKTDPSLQHPRCVFQLLKKHFSRYTLEMMTRITGTPIADFLKVAEAVGATCATNKTMTILYALGWTQHTTGSQNIRCICIIQLLLGNIGMPGGGVNALRGHSNIQGLSDLGLLSTSLPGYLSLPNEFEHPTFQDYVAKQTPKALRPNQLNFWANTPAFMVSFLKWMYGDNATAENHWGYDWLPKWDEMYDILRMVDLMHEGTMQGLLVQGFNAQGSFPDLHHVAAGFSKLKFMVVMDPLKTETASFWQDHADVDHPMDPSTIATEVFRLPTPCFAEEAGSIVNSSRWLQWHHPGAEPPAEALPDLNILAEIMQRLRKLYVEEGGTAPEPIVNLAWDYQNPYAPKAEEMAQESNGRALQDLYDAQGKLIHKKGELLDGFSQLRDDGSTSCATWIFSGSWTQAGNQMDRRDNTNAGLGNTPNWAWAWPANRRILYNRASADPQGKPWDPARPFIYWDGARWTGCDVPDFKADSAPEEGMNPFIMNEEGSGRLFCQRKMVDGPFPEHYEPMESPLASNPLHPQVTYPPAVRRLASAEGRWGTVDEFPYVATTYRLTEHFQFWTKSVHKLMVAQPEQFIEISEELAREKHIRKGDWVTVRSKRGMVKAVAVVTKRLKPFKVDGKIVHEIGIPLHGGWESTPGSRKAYLINTLTPFVGDCNTQTPEYKAFLVNVERA